MLFKDKFNAIIDKNNSLLCIGLDPDLNRMPVNLQSVSSIFKFNKHIIDATHDLVCAYKPNIAFYEAYGLEGLAELKKTMEYLQRKYPHIVTVLDAKRGDIPNTAKMYAKAVYKYWNADSVTVHPSLGLDSITPFLEYKNKLTIILIKTSNPDSGMFQNILVNKKPYYVVMSEKIKEWNYENIGIFIGATYPQELQKVRSLFPEKIFLSAGMGAQLAEVGKAVRNGIDKNGKGIMYNASRSIIYATTNTQFAKRARLEAEKLKNLINTYRKHEK